MPARVVLAYRNAAAALRHSDPGCHLSWSLVAAIGKVESGHAYGGRVDRAGRTLQPILGPVLDGAGDYAAIRDSDGGRWDGDSTWDRAVGPMQFIPSSWAVWGRDGDDDGRVDPSDIDDAALATAAYLCAGDRDLRDESDRRSAVFSYNHSWDYVDLVLAWADAYATGSPVTGTLVGASGSGTGDDAGSAGNTADNDRRQRRRRGCHRRARPARPGAARRAGRGRPGRRRPPAGRRPGLGCTHRGAEPAPASVPGPAPGPAASTGPGTARPAPTPPAPSYRRAARCPARPGR